MHVSFFILVIMIGFVEQMYTFIENETFGIIQVRKSNASYVPLQLRVLGGEYSSFDHITEHSPSVL